MLSEMNNLQWFMRFSKRSVIAQWYPTILYGCWVALLVESRSMNVKWLSYQSCLICTDLRLLSNGNLWRWLLSDHGQWYLTSLFFCVCCRCVYDWPRLAQVVWQIGKHTKQMIYWALAAGQVVPWARSDPTTNWLFHVSNEARTPRGRYWVRASRRACSPWTGIPRKC